MMYARASQLLACSLALGFWACGGASQTTALDGTGGALAGTGGSSSSTGGKSSTQCDPGDTRSCVGPGSCQGGQECTSDGEWSGCDCGDTGTGGSVGTGGDVGSGGVGTGGVVGSGGVGTGGSVSTGGVFGSGATGGVGGTGGTVSTGGTVGTGGGNTGGNGPIALTPTDGWVDGGDNSAGIQGALFTYGDDTTAATMSDDFEGTNACMAGTAAKVNLSCVPDIASDCYGMYWGAALGFNLNQPIDSDTGLPVEEPQLYDASALKGFSFTITGSVIPTALRFKVENASGEFCNPTAKPVTAGSNTFLFTDLVSQCWMTGGSTPTTTGLVKIAWQVYTNTSSSVPFDFCVSNIKALPK